VISFGRIRMHPDQKVSSKIDTESGFILPEMRCKYQTYFYTSTSHRYWRVPKCGQMRPHYADRLNAHNFLDLNVVQSDRIRSECGFFVCRLNGPTVNWNFREHFIFTNWGRICEQWRFCAYMNWRGSQMYQVTSNCKTQKWDCDSIINDILIIFLQKNLPSVYFMGQKSQLQKINILSTVWDRINGNIL
jgi:hypothetical protein